MPVDQQDDSRHAPDLAELAKTRFREGASEVFAENAHRMAQELERLANLDAIADPATRDALASVCAKFGGLAAELDELRAEVGAYCEATRSGEPVESLGDVTSFPDEVEVALGDFIDGSNWHAPEADSGGRPRRWTGPGTRSTVNIYVCRRRPLELVFQIAGAAAPEILDGLRLLVDGEPTEFEFASHLRGRAAIGPAPTRRGVEVAFDVPFTVSPMARDPNQRDKRQLGVALCELALRPLPSPSETDEPRVASASAAQARTGSE